MNADQIKAQFPGYQGWNDRAAIEANFRDTGGAGKGPSLSSGNFSSVDPQQAIQATIKALQEANRPAIESYQASIPETSAKYTQARTQLQGLQPSLEQKYANLVAKIKGQQTEDVNRQTSITAGELGKRGLTGSSTLAQQEIQSAILPLNTRYTGLTSEAELAGADAIRELQNTIANLTPQETADLRAIRNAIGQLSAGAGQAGVSTGLNLYSTNLAAQQAAQQREDQQRQQTIANQLAQAQLANQTAQTQYNIAAPYFKPETGGGGMDLTALLKLLGGSTGTNTNIAPSTWQPASQSTSGGFGRNPNYYG